MQPLVPELTDLVPNDTRSPRSSSWKTSGVDGTALAMQTSIPVSWTMVEAQGLHGAGPQDMQDGCACGQTPCAIAHLQRCDFCGKIQKQICGR
eukprot:COSAG02_NODE_44927_length_361_cov_2.538168_1_plen_92_part_10